MDACLEEEVSRTIIKIIVTLSLASDLVSRNCIESGYFEIGILNLVCKCILG